ncbi:MAG: hypothetical protein LC804_18195 [Acidobacteria bacterium]|nr:hypothetical protein [Acidobacteriota bacterium]
MTSKRHTVIGGAFLTLILALAAAQAMLDKAAAQAGTETVQAPRFEVDPFWPKPLPNHWLLGSTIGVSVDSQDHVWIVHRGGATLNARTEMGAAAKPPTAEECCVPAPPVLEFDAAGNLVGHWGGPGDGYEWPASNHGITVDYRNNVWIGGNDDKDAHVLKFTRSGKFLMQFGHQGKRGGSHDTENFGAVAKIFVDPKTSSRGIGVRTATSRTTQTLAGTIRRCLRYNSSVPRYTARNCHMTGLSTCATVRTIASRCFVPMVRS